MRNNSRIYEAAYALLTYICDKYGDVYCRDDWKCEYHRELADAVGYDYPDTSPTGNGDGPP